MNKTWGRAAVVLCAAALALSGCDDDAEPGASPTPTASSSAASPSTSASGSPSASASPSTNPSVPAAARARTEDGAIAFLKFYFDVVNDGYQDPANAPDVFAYADKDCIACKKGRDHVAEYAKGGWSVKQELLRVLDAAVATPVDGPKVIVNFTLEEVAQTLYQNGKSTSNKTPPSKIKKGAALRWINGGWQMYGMEDM